MRALVAESALAARRAVSWLRRPDQASEPRAIRSFSASSVHALIASWIEFAKQSLASAAAQIEYLSPMATPMRVSPLWLKTP